MRVLPSLSDTLRRLEPRERRVVLGGAIISLTALAIVQLGVPCARTWTTRETAIAASRDQYERLPTLVANTDRLRRTLDARQLAFAADEGRLVTGTTAALAASTLQGLVQRYANESTVQIERVDVAGEPTADQSGLLAIPVQLQARGDLYGLVDFLYRVERGDKLLVVDELTMNSGFDEAIPTAAAPRTQSLSWTLRLHGLYQAQSSS